MRIGLYGSMANNMYCLTKVLKKTGYDAYYINDPTINHPTSFPIWEDVQFTLDHKKLEESTLTTEEWNTIATEHGWQAPSWLVEPEALGRGSIKNYLAMAYRAATVPVRSSLSYYRMTAYFLRDKRVLIQHMAQYDWLILCGEGVMWAYFSGKPYTFIPFGGDIAISPYKTETPYDRWVGAVLPRAVREARVKGANLASAIDDLKKLGVKGEIPYLPFIVDTDRYSPRPETGAGLLPEDVRLRMQGKYVFLLPSRQDFYWKGTDKFLRAFARAVQNGANIFLIVSRWGADVQKTETMIAEAGIQANVHYLEYMMSKPLLIQFYNLVDVVVDQFAFIGYGTAALEAMACAKPVMIGLDIASFKRCWPDYQEPPVINVDDEEGIYHALRQIASGELDLKHMGEEARRWVVEHHGMGQVGRYLPQSRA